MSKHNMTLDEFMEASKATDNKKGNYTVEVTINGEKKTLSVRNCSTEYQAKETVFVHLLQLIEHGRRSNNPTSAWG